jgi:hypothetical protein
MRTCRHARFVCDTTIHGDAPVPRVSVDATHERFLRGKQQICASRHNHPQVQLRMMASPHGYVPHGAITIGAVSAWGYHHRCCIRMEPPSLKGRAGGKAFREGRGERLSGKGGGKGFQGRAGEMLPRTGGGKGSQGRAGGKAFREGRGKGSQGRAGEKAPREGRGGKAPREGRGERLPSSAPGGAVLCKAPGKEASASSLGIRTDHHHLAPGGANLW